MEMRLLLKHMQTAVKINILSSSLAIDVLVVLFIQLNMRC